MSNTHIITRISPLNLAGILGTIYGAVNALVAISLYFATKGLAYVLGYIAGSVVVGFLAGLLIAYVYNVTVRYTGGLRLNVEVSD
jgi:Ca2+-dependent lipid-binding protein